MINCLGLIVVNFRYIRIVRKLNNKRKPLRINANACGTLLLRKYASFFNFHYARTPKLQIDLHVRNRFIVTRNVKMK